MKLNPMLLKDGYKTDHRSQYPKGSNLVYTNGTPRNSRDPRYKTIVNFGIQGFVKKYLMDEFDREFFKIPRAEAVKSYKRRIDNYLGPGAVTYDHIGALHDLGYLPLHLKALPEGMLSPIGIPGYTLVSTKDEFFWLPNALETLIQSETWKPSTNATVAFEFRKVLQAAAKRTNPEMLAFVPWQGHDFSFRGMDGVDSAMRSGAAHLLSFTGTDTIPAIDYLEKYYNADCEKELIGGSVAATEHSVMCMGGQETEEETFMRLLTEVYPNVPVLSVVSDTWDYWDTLTVKATRLKPVIMARPGKLVFRPDSGDPVKIVCGDPEAPVGSPQYKGSIEVLYEIFGGTTTSKGFKQLDPHVGLIYGDSITLERLEQIIAGLEAKGFASTNMVFGIGSFTYQFSTRDTFGFAMKATYGQINGNPVDMFKNPKTDSGIKKSAKGLLRVNSDLTLSQQVTPEEEKGGLLETVFLNGKLVRDESLATIRARLLANLDK